MPSAVDPRIRYAASQPIKKRDGTEYWLRVGNGYQNADGTVDIFFDVFFHGHRVRLRQLEEGECGCIRPARGTA